MRFTSKDLWSYLQWLFYRFTFHYVCRHNFLEVRSCFKSAVDKILCCVPSRRELIIRWKLSLRPMCLLYWGKQSSTGCSRPRDQLPRPQPSSEAAREAILQGPEKKSARGGLLTILNIIVLPSAVKFNKILFHEKNVVIWILGLKMPQIHLKWKYGKYPLNIKGQILSVFIMFY